MVACACKPSTGRQRQEDLCRLKANHSKDWRVGKGTHPGSVVLTLEKLRQEGHQKFKVITSYRMNPYLKMNKSHSERGGTNIG